MSGYLLLLLPYVVPESNPVFALKIIKKGKNPPA
jgi:hypothetical protein